MRARKKHMLLVMSDGSEEAWCAPLTESLTGRTHEVTCLRCLKLIEEVLRQDRNIRQ